MVNKVKTYEIDIINGEPFLKMDLSDFGQGITKIPIEWDKFSETLFKKADNRRIFIKILEVSQKELQAKDNVLLNLKGAVKEKEIDNDITPLETFPVDVTSFTENKSASVLDILDQDIPDEKTSYQKAWDTRRAKQKKKPSFNDSIGDDSSNNKFIQTTNNRWRSRQINQFLKRNYVDYCNGKLDKGETTLRIQLHNWFSKFKDLGFIFNDMDKAKLTTIAYYVHVGFSANHASIAKNFAHIYFGEPEKATIPEPEPEPDIKQLHQRHALANKISDKADEIMSEADSFFDSRKKGLVDIKKNRQVFQPEDITFRIPLFRHQLIKNTLHFNKEDLDNKGLKIGQIFGFYNVDKKQLVKSSFLRSKLTISLTGGVELDKIFSKKITDVGRKYEICQIWFSRHCIKEEFLETVMKRAEEWGVSEKFLCIEPFQDLTEVKEQMQSTMKAETEQSRDN